MDQMKTKASSYVNTYTRMARDDNTFVTMLWNSITDAVTAVVALRTSDFAVNGVTSGLLLFKSLLIHSKVNGVNDPGLIHRKMANAFDLLHSLNHDVRKFNQAYRGLDQQLSQCGQVFTDGKVFMKKLTSTIPTNSLLDSSR
jgi:hypothetical protein